METNCYIHKNIPSSKICSHCHKSICHECSIQLRPSYDYITDGFGNRWWPYIPDFCPYCFVSISPEKGFDKPVKFLINPSFLKDQKFILGIGTAFSLYIIISVTSYNNSYPDSNMDLMPGLIFVSMTFLFLAIFIYYVTTYIKAKDPHNDFKRAQKIIKQTESKI